MIGTPFYNATIKKYVALFGALFNNIVIEREGEGPWPDKQFKVPLAYGPRDKFLARAETNPEINELNIPLPRMGFEFTDISYDPERVINPLNKVYGYTNGVCNEMFAPTPWNFGFKLEVLAKQKEDAMKIAEQILPNFKPELTISAHLVDGFPNLSLDLPLVLNGVDQEDNYESSFYQRRIIIWTFNFTLRGYLFGPTSPAGKVIKFAKINTMLGSNSAFPSSTVYVRAGITANGQPTSNVYQTDTYPQIPHPVDYLIDSEFNPDFPYLVTIEESN